MAVITPAKPTCSFCPGTGHTWAVEADQRACFQCLRRRFRPDYTEEGRHAVATLIGLKGELRQLAGTIQRILAQLEEKA